MDRRCKKCGVVKDIAAFGRHARTKDGVRANCKECENAENRGRREANRAHYRTYHREYNRAHAAAVNGAARERRSREPDRIKAKDRRYRLKNRERLRAYGRRWIKEHRDSHRLGWKVYIHRKRTTEGTFSARDIRAIYQAQAGLCAYCTVELDGVYHIDHRVSIARGGTNWPDNLALTCPICNMSKQTKTPEEFAAYRADLALLPATAPSLAPMPPPLDPAPSTPAGRESPSI